MILSVGSKTLYVRDADLDLWSRAEEFARRRRLSMSALVLLAIEKLLDEEGSG